MNHRSSYFLLLLIFSTRICSAQKLRTISLSDAVDLSLKNSKQLKVSSARIIDAMAQVEEASQMRLPDLKINSSYMRLNNAKFSLNTGGSDSSGRKGEVPKVNQLVYGTVTFSLPLFSGGLIKNNIESSKFLAEAVKLDAVADRDQVIFNTTSAYVNLYKAYESVILVKENLISSMSRDSSFSNMEKNGLLARNDLLKSQLQTSQIKLTLLNAENDLKMATIAMNLLLGFNEQDSLVVDTSFVNHLPDAGDFNAYEQNALLHRSDVESGKYRLKSANSAIRSAKAGDYPSVVLTGGYMAGYIPGILTVTNALNIGIGLQYNLANLWKSNTRLKQANAHLKEVNIRNDMLDDDIRMGVNRDYQAYLLSLKRINLYQEALNQSVENFRITKNKYENNLATLTDLLEADVARLQSKINISSSKADAVLAYTKLLQTSGLLNTHR